MLDALHSLSVATLRALAASLRSGPLAMGLSRHTLTQTVGSQALAVHASLEALQQQGMTSAHIALTRPLTVITGPPGTGKSQVVSCLLINAAKLGKRVLFSRKNDKAVDVVETRVNSLGPRPVLLRLGRPAPDAPTVRWVPVQGVVVRPGSGALNEIEAKAVVKELERLCVQQGYSGTVGVVTPFRAQANRIRDPFNVAITRAVPR